jgi:hypothetical protein
MNLISEVARLKELEAKATPVGWIKATQPEYDADYETADRLVGGLTGRDEYDRDEGIVRADDDGWGQIVCRPDLERDADFIANMRNAAPTLLDALGEIRVGDRQLLAYALDEMEEIHHDPSWDAVKDVLQRYCRIAATMEGRK